MEISWDNDGLYLENFCRFSNHLYVRIIYTLYGEMMG